MKTACGETLIGCYTVKEIKSMQKLGKNLNAVISVTATAKNLMKQSAK